MQWRRTPTLPGRLPPPPGRWDPPPLDRRDDSTEARRWRSLATATTSMPAIHIGALFIGQEDWEGNNGSGVAMEDDDNTNAEAGGYAHDFLEVVLHQLWEGHFVRRRRTTKKTETSRDDEHKEDVVMRLMFGMLCEGEPLSSLSTARPKRRSSATTTVRVGGADLLRMKRSQMGRRRRRRLNGECIGDDNDYERLPYIQWRDDAHIIIMFNKKHIICLIFCNQWCAAEATRWHTIPWNINMISMD